MLPLLSIGARALPVLSRLAGGRAFAQQILPGLGGMGWKDAALRYGPELAFAGLSAAQAPGDIGGKGIAFAESLGAGLIPSFGFQRLGFSAGHRAAASKGLLHGTPEFNQKVGEYTNYGDMAAMVPSFLYPMPLTQGLYQKEAERQQVLAQQQQQLEPANGIMPLPSGMSGIEPPRQEAAATGDPFDIDALTQKLAREQMQAAANSIMPTSESFTRMAAVPGFESMFDELNPANMLRV